MELPSGAKVIHTDYIDAHQMGFPRRKPDPRGKIPEVTEDADADWKVPFPLSDGSGGETEDEAPGRDDGEHEHVEEPHIEGSSRYPSWLQRLPHEMDNKYAGCNTLTARKGQPTRQLRVNSHHGVVQALRIRNPDDGSSESELDDSTLKDHAGNYELSRDAAF